MQPYTYQTGTGHTFELPVCPPKSAPITTNPAAEEFPRSIQIHVAQVDQWNQMMISEDILKQHFME